ncbi:MAG: PQQ-binding-like beta-propeller repeat protein [Proteobacteria bacterium]|nr:PQQ-binding-like beta-propeller repeat protein [Pseudomonadota bacterium]
MPIAAADAPVECESDAGIHGEDAVSPRRFAANGTATQPWSASAADAISWTGPVVTLYGANWLNWYNSTPIPGQISRLSIVKAVAKQIVSSLDSANLGLMRFSANGGDGDAAAEGGMVVQEVVDLRRARASVLQVIDNLQASGFTPLSETLYEAGQYWAGRPVDYGLNSQSAPGTPLPSVAGSRDPSDPGRYKSPIEYQCQRNYTVLLTDGEPSADNSADDKIQTLPGYTSAVGASCSGEGPGRRLDEMAKYLNRADLSTLAGQQNSQVFTIGVGPEITDSASLAAVASAGGGRSYNADNIDDLTTALQDVVTTVLETSSTFTTPSVGINAFNRTQTVNDLYVSVFSPRETIRWPGNLKKYALRNGEIVDALGNSAVDPSTGFFRRGTRSFWSPTPDEDRVTDGGAASQLPSPATRRVYTYLPTPGNRNLTAAVNAVTVGNTNLTDALLGTGSTGPTREQVIDWARGVDIQDLDADGNITEAARSMGDPLHARPALVSFGGALDTPDPRDVVVLVPTNDGVLHAIDARTGVELWSFVPPELLGRLRQLVENRPQNPRSYGLDGDVRVLKFDRNQNGVVEPGDGDRVWAYFGMRRGGRNYYALDITDRARPQLLWILGPNNLSDVGESWSTPAIARVRVAGAAQNGEKLVLIFGGGYDGGQENYSYRTDTMGNGIYMVDAASGALLWYAGGPGGTGAADLDLPNMTHSIPSRIVTLDNDGDGFADRLYAADLGGRVWRFDIFNGQGRGSLVTGGVFASLGGAVNPSPASTRRFYYAPDVALIQRRGAEPYYNLAIGSGYRGHPLDASAQDRFYSLRDKNPFGKLSQSQYDSATPLGEGDLIDITNDPAGAVVPTTANGWRLELRLNGGWSGEKVLAESLTVGGIVLFPTYQPQAPSTLDPCSPANGLNRVYALSVDTGKPAIDFNDVDADSVPNNADLFTNLAQRGIAGEISFAFDAIPQDTDPLNDLDQSDNSRRTDALGRRALCAVGLEVLDRCVLPGSVMRTFWQRTAPP